MKNYAIKTKSIRRGSVTIGPIKINVEFSSAIQLPWPELRPMVVHAINHVRAQALRSYGVSYVHRIWAHTLKITNGKEGWRGRSRSTWALVRIGDLFTAPRRARYPKFNDMPEFWHRDWREMFVGLTAHEFWHSYTKEKSGRPAEHDCELVEWDTVDAWRKHCGYTFTPPEEVKESPPVTRADIVSVPGVQRTASEALAFC